MGPRETKVFTVTFSPNMEGKGPGLYRSIVMATPSLTQEELQIAEDAEEFKEKGSLGIVSFKLFADCIVPALTLDKKARIDGLYHLNFKQWSFKDDPEAPDPIQKVTYTNQSKADLFFNLMVDGPFQIVKTKTNTNAKHP